jgi:hypothetical protein
MPINARKHDSLQPKGKPTRLAARASLTVKMTQDEAAKSPKKRDGFVPITTISRATLLRGKGTLE